MSYFIELTRTNGQRVTVNTDHIATISRNVGGVTVVTEVMLGGGILPAFAHVRVLETYEEVTSLLPASQVAWEVTT
jgi:hypothetical protein